MAGAGGWKMVFDIDAYNNLSLVSDAGAIFDKPLAPAGITCYSKLISLNSS